MIYSIWGDLTEKEEKQVLATEQFEVDNER